MLRQLRHFAKFPFNEQLLYPEATLCLAWARYQVRTTRFGDLQRRLAREPKLATQADQQAPLASRIGRVIRTASRHLPWECSCLVQALAARTMLRRRRLAAVLHIGYLRGNEHFESHAWLSYGEEILTGAQGHDRFSEMVRL